MASETKQVQPQALVAGGLGSMTVSGMIPTSGTAFTGTSGPWMIEEQSLTIDYVRVPSFGYDPMTITHSLSGPSRSVEVSQTFLNAKVTATYSRTKSYDYFTTSSWQQPQIFLYNVEDSDIYGNSYGGVGVSALGPMGTINTQRNWYNRRLWASSTDTTSLETCFGTTHYFQGYRGFPLAIGGGVINYIEPKDGLYSWGNMTLVSPNRNAAHTFMNGISVQQAPGVQLYSLGGTYSTAAESPSQIQMFIDSVGELVRNLLLYDIDPNLTISTVDDTMAVADIGCPSYSNTRHEWS